MFVDIIKDWCVTCKFVKIVALDSIRMLELFKIENFIVM